MTNAITADTPSGVSYAELIGGVIRRVYAPRPCAAKELARTLKKSHRTCERYISGERVPTGDDLIALLRDCKELQIEVLKIMDIEHANDRG